MNRSQRHEVRENRWHGQNVRHARHVRQDRHRWHGPRFHSSHRYRAFRPGYHITRVYYAPRYWIGDPWRYGLRVPGRNLRWVRWYDDLLLVDIRRGIVIEVLPDYFW